MGCGTIKLISIDLRVHHLIVGPDVGLALFCKEVTPRHEGEVAVGDGMVEIVLDVGPEDIVEEWIEEDA